MSKKILKSFINVSVIFIFVVFCAQKGLNASNQQAGLKHNFGKVLVVYYSLSGNTKAVAEKIKENTNADIYEIKTTEQYPSSLMIYIKSKKQKNPKNYPALQENFPDFEKYDLIFVGSPVWWYSAASPVLSFLSKVDFKSKKVVSFATHGGNFGSFFEDFENKAKNAQVIRGRDFKKVLKQNQDLLDKEIADWLSGLTI